ncbi:MAG: hypothetical protein RL650_2666, partial [Pseudomonadota bacterium]
MSSQVTSRRQFLKSTGAITLSFGIPLMDVHSQSPVGQDKPRLAGDLQIHRKLNAWIRIDSANKMVELRIGKVELGQGILTAVAQVCAEELDVDFAQINLISGDTALVPDEGVTAGSFSMPYCATAVQAASAEVRAILLNLAETKLNQSAQQMTVEKGVIRAINGAQISYWDLVVGESLNREATGLVKPKPFTAYRYIGRSVPRPDIQAKVMGQAIFVQEQRPKGMLFGQIVRPPNHGARLQSVNFNLVEKMPGVVKVVRNGSFLGVIAKREAQAQVAAQALQNVCEWQVPHVLPKTQEMQTWLLQTKPNVVIPTKKQDRSNSVSAA